MSKFSLCVVFLASLLFNTCSVKKSDKNTWLAGKIDNPTQDFILVQYNRVLIDSVKLDENNFFHYKFKETVKEGMYTFIHENSYSFYIAPGDSLLVVGNTLDFDSSLYYSNDHAAENNFIQLLFKRLKYESFHWSELHKFSVEEFDNELNRRHKEAIQLLKEFKINNPNTSNSFMRIAKGTIEQERLLNRERYIQAHFSNDYGIDKILPESFFTHRKEISFDQDTMEVYFPYYKMLDTYFDNLVINYYDSKELFNRSDYELNEFKMQLMDSIVNNQSIKNQLLYTTTRNFLLHTKSELNEEKLLSLHNQMSDCTYSKANLVELKKHTSRIKTGNLVPNTRLISIDNTEVELSHIITKPSLIYFWSYKDIKHQKNIHARVLELEAKYPEYQFIGINTDDHFKTWRNEVSKLGYTKENEFQLYNPKQGKEELVVNVKNKILLLDENAIIYNGHTNIFHRNIENELLQYLNM